MTMTVYELHIKMCFGHHIDHLQLLFAYATLRAQGNSRITKEAMEQRKNLIDMICKLLGIPFGPWVVTARPTEVPFAEIADGAMMPVMTMLVITR